MKILNKISWIEKFIFEDLPIKHISIVNYKLSDLLYAFPAETRLTVYRRLDRAQLARLGSAKNSTTLENFIRLIMFCSMTDKKMPRISCPEYIEN